MLLMELPGVTTNPYSVKPFNISHTLCYKIVDNSDVVGAVADIRGLTADCGNSSVLAMELLQSCAKPLINQLLVTFKSPYKVFNYNKARPKTQQWQI